MNSTKPRQRGRSPQKQVTHDQVNQVEFIAELLIALGRRVNSEVLSEEMVREKKAVGQETNAHVGYKSRDVPQSLTNYLIRLREVFHKYIQYIVQRCFFSFIFVNVRI